MKAALMRRPAAITPLLAATALLIVVTVDQITKSMAVQRLLAGPVDGPGPLRFRLMANRGALMGLPMPVWLLVAVIAVIMVMATSSLARLAPRRVGLGWGLLVGGAIGNLVDRFQHRPRFPDHAVVDWVASSFLPTFNIADVAIVAGLVLLAAPGSSSDRSELTQTRDAALSE